MDGAVWYWFGVVVLILEGVVFLPAASSPDVQPRVRDMPGHTESYHQPRGLLMGPTQTEKILQQLVKTPSSSAGVVDAEPSVVTKDQMNDILRVIMRTKSSFSTPVPSTTSTPAPIDLLHQLVKKGDISAQASFPSSSFNVGEEDVALPHAPTSSSNIWGLPDQLLGEILKLMTNGAQSTVTTTETTISTTTTAFDSQQQLFDEGVQLFSKLYGGLQDSFTSEKDQQPSTASTYSGLDVTSLAELTSLLMGGDLGSVNTKPSSFGTVEVSKPSASSSLKDQTLLETTNVAAGEITSASYADLDPASPLQSVTGSVQSPFTSVSADPVNLYSFAEPSDIDDRLNVSKLTSAVSQLLVRAGPAFVSDISTAVQRVRSAGMWAGMRVAFPAVTRATPSLMSIISSVSPLVRRWQRNQQERQRWWTDAQRGALRRSDVAASTAAADNSEPLSSRRRQVTGPGRSYQIGKLFGSGLKLVAYVVNFGTDVVRA